MSADPTAEAFVVAREIMVRAFIAGVLELKVDDDLPAQPVTTFHADGFVSTKVVGDVMFSFDVSPPVYALRACRTVDDLARLVAVEMSAKLFPGPLPPVRHVDQDLYRSMKASEDEPARVIPESTPLAFSDPPATIRDIEAIVRQLVAFDGDLTPDMHLVDDLGLDSMERVELVIQLECQLSIEFTSDETEQLGTAGELVALVDRKLRERGH